MFRRKEESSVHGHTVYLGEKLSATDGYPISQNTDRLTIAKCRIGGVELPKIDLYLPANARVFFFEGPVLVIGDSSGEVLERIAPIYMRL